MKRNGMAAVLTAFFASLLALSLPPDGLTQQPAGKQRFTVPDGFRVEEAVRVPAGDKTFSLVNMCFDAKGRLLVSRENGPILLCTEPDKNDVLQKVADYCTQVSGCQGMCWVKDALLLVGKGPQGAGLYRCRDTKGGDKIDEVKLLHAIKGDMGDHGPHAILHGPDGWLYLVLGNHSWAQLGKEAPKNGVNPDKLAANSPLKRWPTGIMGPDQGKAKSTEDVLLPRMNDPRAADANILAPGGTIWRMDLEGKNVSLFAAGFRNQFDAAFAPNGELFAVDSDHGADVGLPWYRPARVCHVPPGADFLWRTGAANTPSYYIDSLPPVAELGRGSLTGVEFYDHHLFPEEYRGAMFVGDWLGGVINVVHLQRNGATYKTKVERFCTAKPLNVTDLAVGPDGALYFALGGHGSVGGVFRIAYDAKLKKPDPRNFWELLRAPQIISAWGQANRDWFIAELLKEHNKEYKIDVDLSTLLSAVASKADNVAAGNEGKNSVNDRIRALNLLLYAHKDISDLRRFDHACGDEVAEIRAQSIWHLGSYQQEGKGNPALKHFEAALGDKDAFVRRRACEALIRAGHEPPIANLWPLLNDKDRFVRHAARLVLERIDPKKWADKCWKEANDTIAYNGIVALCHTNKATAYGEQIFDRLHGSRDPKAKNQEPTLEWLRTLQLAMASTPRRPIWTEQIAKHCVKLFPHKDAAFNRELAILMVEFQREGHLDQPVQAKLIKALQGAKNDRPQQIHYVYCMRLLQNGWTPETAKAITAWHEGTRDWTGGASFRPFLDAIYTECARGFARAEKYDSP